jgi:hypothetical protein
MWSLKYTGSTRAVLARVLGQKTPDDQRNQLSFRLASQLIVETLKEACQASEQGQVPAHCVEVTATGFFAHDGRARVQIEVNPVALEFESPQEIPIKLSDVPPIFSVTPQVAFEPTLPPGVTTATSAAALPPGVTTARESCQDCGAVAGTAGIQHTRGCPKF